MATILCCQLELHDSLYFASREIGRLYETERIIHNYALGYALGLVTSPYFISKQSPTYKQDFSDLNNRKIYVTPAGDVAIDYMLNTWKYADNHYYVKPERAQKNIPGYGRLKEIAVGSKFIFFIISQKEDYYPPRWIRLGKWMSKARIEFERIDNPSIKQGEYFVNCPLNPLDLGESEKIKTCDLINMPPVSLIQNASLNGEYYEFSVPTLNLDSKVKLPGRMSFNFK